MANKKIKIMTKLIKLLFWKWKTLWRIIMSTKKLLENLKLLKIHEKKVPLKSYSAFFVVTVFGNTGKGYTTRSGSERRIQSAEFSIFNWKCKCMLAYAFPWLKRMKNSLKISKKVVFHHSYIDGCRGVDS